MSRMGESKWCSRQSEWCGDESTSCVLFEGGIAGVHRRWNKDNRKRSRSGRIKDQMKGVGGLESSDLLICRVGRVGSIRCFRPQNVGDRSILIEVDHGYGSALFTE